jgi:hypothetical protein
MKVDPCPHCGSPGVSIESVSSRYLIRYGCENYLYSGELHDGSPICIERQRIISYLTDYRIPDPKTDSKAIPCEHDVYSWHICDECAVDELKRIVRGGKP